ISNVRGNPGRRQRRGAAGPARRAPPVAVHARRADAADALRGERRNGHGERVKVINEHRHIILPLLALLALPTASFAQGGAAPTVIGGRTPNQDAVLDRVALVQRMDAQVPLDTPFRDETGRTITL